MEGIKSAHLAPPVMRLSCSLACSSVCTLRMYTPGFSGRHGSPSAVSSDGSPGGAVSVNSGGATTATSEGPAAGSSLSAVVDDNLFVASCVWVLGRLRALLCMPCPVKNV